MGRIWTFPMVWQCGRRAVRGVRSVNTQTSNITLPVTLTCDGIAVVVKLGMEYRDTVDGGIL